MKTSKIVTDYLLLFIPNVIGVILFSQGISFAMCWNSQPTSFHVNLHAGLLAAAGVAVIFLCILARQILQRLDALEKKNDTSR